MPRSRSVEQARGPREERLRCGAVWRGTWPVEASISRELPAKELVCDCARARCDARLEIRERAERRPRTGRALWTVGPPGDAFVPHHRVTATRVADLSLLYSTPLIDFAVEGIARRHAHVAHRLATE